MNDMLDRVYKERKPNCKFVTITIQKWSTSLELLHFGIKDSKNDEKKKSMNIKTII